MSANQFSPHQGRAGFLGGVYVGFQGGVTPKNKVYDPDTIKPVLTGLQKVFGNALQIIKTDAESITFQVSGFDSETAFRELERRKADVFGFGPNWSLGPLPDAASRAGACEWRMGQFQVMRPGDGKSSPDIYIRWLGTAEQRKEFAAGF